MKNSFIESNLKRCSRNFLVINIIILLVLSFVLLLAGRYLYNFFYGPFHINETILNTISDPNSLEKYFVTVKGEECFDIGLQMVEEGNNYERVISNYYLLFVGEKYIVVDVPSINECKQIVSGALKKLPAELEQELLIIAEENGISKEEFKADLLPMVLDAANFKAPGYLLIFICVLVGLILVRNFTLFLFRTIFYDIHPIYKSLATYGNPSELISQIDQEIQQNSHVFQDIIITDSWLFIKTWLNLKAIKLEELVWVYKQETRNAYVKSGLIYQLVFNLKNKKMILSPQGKEEIFDDVLAHLQKRFSWIIIGYSSELKQVWDKNPQEMVALAEKNKAASSKLFGFLGK